MSVEPHDETTHAKPKPSEKRRGLLAGRFRPGPLIEYDVFRTSHEAVDEADGSRVVVHFLSERFAQDRAMRRETASRLLERVGHGNQFVSPLVEAGVEHDRVFVVEPRARGVSLRSVLRARARTRKPLTAKELLPVVARIKAGMDALPDELVLGRISPRTVHIDEDGLLLAECFILPCLDRAALKALLAEDEALGHAYAPELARGLVTRSADDFAVGALVHEALSFLVPSDEISPSLGALDRDVRALLVATPESRPGLADIVEKLAELAELRLPELDAQPFELPAATRAARLAELDDDGVELLEEDEDEDDGPQIREEDKTRQVAFPKSGPVIDDLAQQIGKGRLPAPEIDIEAPASAVRADAPKAPPPAKRPRATRKDSTGEVALPAPKSSPPPALAQPEDVEEVISAPPPPPPYADTPSVEVRLTPVPARADATDRIRKRPGETTLSMRAVEEREVRPASARRRGPRPVLVAMILAGMLLAVMLGVAVVRKREQEALRQQMIEQRLREIREE